MKVVHAIPDYDVAGAGKYLLTLLKRAEYTSRVDPLVCCPEGPLAEAIRALGFGVRQLPGRDRSFTPAAVSQMFNILRQERPELVHTHASLSARIAARAARVPVVFTKHTPDSTAGSRFKAAIQRALSDGVIAVSEYVAALLKGEGYPENRIRVIYNGVDPDEYRPAQGQLKPHDWTSGAVKIGTVGRLVPEKGHAYLVRAAAIVVKQCPRCEFFIAGDGPEKAHLRQLIAELGLHDSVHLTGYLQNVPSFLRGLDLFVFPSLDEGLGIALIEAMMSGLPVIASSAGGIPEVVKDGVTGELIAPADPLALARAIAGLIKRPEKADTYAKNAIDWAARNFNAADMASQTADFYEEILGGGR